jgi:hypothetical protein
MLGTLEASAVAGPLWGKAIDVVAAIATAAVAVRAVERAAKAAGTSSDASNRALRRAARDAARREGAPLAAHAVEVLYRAKAGDCRAWRSAAMLVGCAFSPLTRDLVP